MTTKQTIERMKLFAKYSSDGTMTDIGFNAALNEVESKHQMEPVTTTKSGDLKESTFIGLTTNIMVISIAMHSNHIPDFGTKQELNDQNSHTLFAIAKELNHRFKSMKS